MSPARWREDVVVEFRILGPVDVLAEGRPLAVGGRRERAVLALLLLSANRVVSSERLADELWPDRLPKEALHSLRVAVSRLRKVLHEAAGAEVLCTVSPGYVIRTDPDTLDLARFESLLVRARAEMARHQPQQAGESLREALSLWRGAALADLAETAFARAESARLEEARLTALEARVEADLVSGRHAELPAELDSLTRAHPLRETLWGQRMLALYRSGRQADALRVFRELRQILGEELGIEPSARLVDLESAMLRQEPGLEWKAAAPELEPEPGAGAPFSDRTPFVGREAEQTELRRLVAQVRSGTGTLIMIGGEPGVGKTRLAEELSVDCSREGFQTFTGHCYEMAGAVPYVPLVEAYEQALARAPGPEAFRRFLGGEAPEIARLVPMLRRVCPDIPPPLDLPADQERRYLFNSIWEVLARTARSRPTLLVLDDIHWADEPTMLLIQHLAERIAEVPVLMVGLYRDSEVDVGRPLSRTFEELARRRLARRLTLRRLPPESVAEMLEGLAGQEPPSRLVEVIYSETEGNPFFTEEVFKHLAEEGRLFDASGRFRTDLSGDELDVPEGVRLVVGARLRRLGDDGRMALGSAAVLGRVFSFELLRHLAELPEDRLLGLVEEAERARLITTVKDGGADDRFMFAHELIRQTVLAELSAPRRRRLHARAADALERIHASDLGPQAAAIAHHLIEAGPVAASEQTFRALVMAGRFALETAAFEEALRHLEGAAQRVDAATPADRAELLDLRARAARSGGRWAEATATWHEAVDAYEALGDEAAVGRVALQAAYGLLWAFRAEESFEIAQRALAMLGEAVTGDRARLLAHAGCMIAAADESAHEVGDDFSRQGLAIADQLDDPTVRGHCLQSLCLQRWAFMRQAECAEAGLQAAELLRAAGDLWGVASVLGFATIGVAEMGRFGEALSLVEELDPLCERIGNYPALMQARRVRAVIAFCTAPDLAALEAFARADLELTANAGMPWFDHQSFAWLGLAHFLAGDWDAAGGHFQEAFKGEPMSILNGWNRALLFEHLAYAGDRAGAMALLDKAEDNRLPVAGRPNAWGRWMMLLSAVEGLYVMGERDRAARLYDLVVECIQQTRAVCPNYYDARLPERAAGIAAAAGRRWDDAERHFRTALQQSADLPHLPEQAHTRRFFAAMLLERDGPGDRAAANQMAAEAAELYRRMGMPRHLAMVAEASAI